MSIDRLLRDTEATPLPMDVLSKMCGKGPKCRAIMYDKVETAKSLDEIVNQTHPYAILLIMDKRDQDSNVGHYCALWLQGQKVMWMDPYGNSVDVLMKLTQNKNNLMQLVRSSGKTISMNKKRLQRMNGKIATCARHCSVRLRMAEWSHDRYYKFLQSKKMNPDEVVTMLTMVYKAGKEGHHDALEGGDIDKHY